MKKNFILTLTAIAMTATLLTGCGAKSTATTAASTTAATTNESSTSSDEIKITHVKGETLIKSPVKKAVVFDMGVLDTIDTLGIDVELAVPTDSLPSYLSKYESVTNAGGIKEPDMEAIYAFEPDVIFISGRQEGFYDELNKLAPTIYVELNSASYIDDFKKNTDTIATVFGVQQDKTASYITDIDTKIAQVQTLTKDMDQKALIILANDGSLSAYGKGSRFGMIHDVLGVPVADESIDVSTHGQEVGFEYISQVNPDILFVVDRTVIVGGENTAVKTLDNDLVNGTKAAKNGKIVTLNSEYWYLSGGGLTSINGMVDEVKAALK